MTDDHQAIRIEGVSKRFRIHSAGPRPHYRTLREEFSRLALKACQRLKGAVADGETDFWALRDVTFDVPRGEVVGVVGRNGAGKSTLLKIVSRITRPTAGTVQIRGRVGSLLEVGTGFHPELTGRENIFLNGAILGMTHREIVRKFDAIVDFAGTETFLDSPVKHYSSGMYMRLAFAVAAQLDPEVLLIDEVLAVGDGAFQAKCLGKMGDLATQGRTILFVSHNLAAVRSLCKTAVWLDQGRIVQQGATSDVVGGYIDSGERLASQRTWNSPETAPGNERIRVRSVRIVPALGDPLAAITTATPITFEFECWNFLAGAEINLNLVLHNLEGVCIFNSISPAVTLPAGLFRSECALPGDLLNDGVYSIRLVVVKDQVSGLLDLPNLAMFEVHEAEVRARWFGKHIGAVRPRLDWTTRPIEQLPGQPLD
ncbi:MAG TPA: ABC transporter ATP-binding protein [Pirellulales bacterium]|nr:ABC transporter ATP-binding protein [Pirellulales bacterium]